MDRSRRALSAAQSLPLQSASICAQHQRPDARRDIKGRRSASLVLALDARSFGPGFREGYRLPEAPSMPRIAIFPVATSTGQTGDVKPVVTAIFWAPFAV